MSLERLARAADAAACDTLGQLGPALIGLGVWTLWAKGVGAIPLAAGAASNLAYNYACSEFEPGGAPNASPARGCIELSAGTGNFYLNPPGGSPVLVYSQITGYRLGDSWEQGGNTLYWWSVQREIGGPYVPEGIPLTVPPDYTCELVLNPGAVCGTNAPFVPPLPPTTEPYDYTDPETGCVLNVNFQGFLQASEGGDVQPVYLIKSAGNDASRANYGRMGGCNFAPTIYYGGPGGPTGPGGPGGPGGPVNIPVPDGPYPPPGPNGEPWWMDFVKGALGGAAAGVVGELLENLFSETYPEMLYRAVSVCEKDESGEPISEAVEVEIPALKAPDAQIARLDAIVELLQAHKNFKQPICGNEKPELLGDWVTTRWESDEKMVDSGRRLRKLFRYRTQSSRDLGQLSAYWRDFTWKSGPVCVIHKGAWWGTPQIWAESAEEGKRVIRHAATEAGLDPDKIGGWTISSSRSPRNGMPGTMKILKKEGYPWIASRQGTDWPNYLAS